MWKKVLRVVVSFNHPSYLLMRGFQYEPHEQMVIVIGGLGFYSGIFEQPASHLLCIFCNKVLSE